MQVNTTRAEVRYSIVDLTEEQAIAIAILLGRATDKLSTITYEVYDKLDDALQINGWSWARRNEEYEKA